MNPQGTRTFGETLFMLYAGPSAMHFLLVAMAIGAIALPQQHRNVTRRTLLAVAYSPVAYFLMLCFHYLFDGPYFSSSAISRPASLIVNLLTSLLGSYLFLSAAFANRPSTRRFPRIRFCASSIALLILYLAIFIAFWNATDGFSLRSIRWRPGALTRILLACLTSVPNLVALVLACRRHRDDRPAFTALGVGCALLLLAEISFVYLTEFKFQPGYGQQHYQAVLWTWILQMFGSTLTSLSIFVGRWNTPHGSEAVPGHTELKVEQREVSSRSSLHTAYAEAANWIQCVRPYQVWWAALLVIAGTLLPWQYKLFPGTTVSITGWKCYLGIGSVKISFGLIVTTLVVLSAVFFSRRIHSSKNRYAMVSSTSIALLLVAGMAMLGFLVGGEIRTGWGLLIAYTGIIWQFRSAFLWPTNSLGEERLLAISK